MRIVIFHQHYLAPGQGGGSRFNELARFWCERDHEVIVVAGSVTHAGRTRSRVTSWKLYTEEDGAAAAGPRVWRCWVPDTYAGSYFHRALAFLGYMLSAAWASLFLPRPDVVIATSPPLVAVVPAWIASWLRGRRCPWIFEIRDLWPESAITTGVIRERSLLARLLYGLERFAAWSADRVNVLTPAFREDLVRRGLATEEKVVFVPNGADLESFHPAGVDEDLRAEFGWGGRHVVLYAGAHGRANALDQLVRAAILLRHRPDTVIACVGDGTERAKLAAACAREGLENILFHGPQPKDRMPAIVNSAAIGVAVLQRNPTFLTVYPNKVFDYMACAKPVLLAIDGVARQLVCGDAEAGRFATPEDAADLARHIIELVDSPVERARLGANGLRWVRANAGREQLAEKYLGILLELASPPANPAGTSAPRPAHRPAHR
jgi:glycosyltransferase involved in cell wall biosynthesis